MFFITIWWGRVFEEVDPSNILAYRCGCSILNPKSTFGWLLTIVTDGLIVVITHSKSLRILFNIFISYKLFNLKLAKPQTNKKQQNCMEITYMCWTFISEMFWLFSIQWFGWYLFGNCFNKVLLYNERAFKIPILTRRVRS